MDGNIHHMVQEALGILSSSRDAAQISEALGKVKKYLSTTKNPPSVKDKEEFTRNNFTAFLQGLIRNLNLGWQEQFQTDEEKELWDSFFLEGPADQAFMVRLDSIISTDAGDRKALPVIFTEENKTCFT